MEEIPSSLILNWDHTGLKCVPVSSWTMAPQGSKKVSLAGIDDKRQITGVFAVTLDGNFLPPQLIYQGTTSSCLPRVKCPSDWHVTHSPNHWANESTTKDYIQKSSIVTCQRSKQNFILRIITLPCVFSIILRGS